MRQKVWAWLCAVGTFVVGVIGFLQGPSAIEDIHRRACGWSENWKHFAELIEPCSVATVDLAASRPAPVDGTKAARPDGFEKPVELGATYPGEFWRVTTPEEIAWMEGEWCFQVVDTRAKMSVRNGLVERTASSALIDRHIPPNATGRVITRYAAYVSNRGVFRLKDTAGKGPSIFYQHNETDPRALWEFGRALADDGSVTTGKKYQALDCNRCKVHDGFYTCK